MAILGFFKAEPTEYVLAYNNGRIFCQGAGRAFWYWAPSTSIVLMPVATVDALFVFNETTRTFQPVTVQGQLTYRITAPETLARLLNFTIHPRTRQYRADDPQKLDQRIINVVQMHTRAELQQLGLEAALLSTAALAHTVLTRMQAEPSLGELGVEIVSLFFTALKPTPELAKALEAESREALQQRADQAIYARRAVAVEQERAIKQNELSTAVDLEQRRQELVTLQGANTQAQAAFEAEALRIHLSPYQELDPRLVLGIAFRDFAANSAKIGNLTITTEILEQLLNR
jgi:hypothetical protein